MQKTLDNSRIIADNQMVQFPRRGFLRLLSALPAALAVWRSTPVQAAPVNRSYPHTFEGIRAQCREIVRQYPDSKVIGMGSDAINCYEAGLMTGIQPVRSADELQHPKFLFGYKRVMVVPSLQPWDVAAEVTLTDAQKWWLTQGAWRA